MNRTWQDFWAFVPVRPADGCWLWLGSCDRSGYGRISIGGRAGRVERAHRVAWEREHGPIPPGRKVVHRCDSPSCVNPAHLRLGTMRDALTLAKRRGNTLGPKRPACVLTDQQVREIRLFAARGARHDRLGERYGVAASTVTNIVNYVRRQGAGNHPLMAEDA